MLDNLLFKKKKNSLGDEANDQGLCAKQLSAKGKRLKTFSKEKELIYCIKHSKELRLHDTMNIGSEKSEF